MEGDNVRRVGKDKLLQEEEIGCLVGVSHLWQNCNKIDNDDDNDNTDLNCFSTKVEDPQWGCGWGVVKQFGVGGAGEAGRKI